jgi:hypothetical protein
MTEFIPTVDRLPTVAYAAKKTTIFGRAPYPNLLPILTPTLREGSWGDRGEGVKQFLFLTIFIFDYS